MIRRSVVLSHITAFLCLGIAFGYSQTKNHDLDSLRYSAHTVRQDTSRLATWLQIARLTNDTAEAIAYLDSAAHLSTQLTSPYHHASVLIGRADFLRKNRQNSKAMDLLEEAIPVIENSDDLALLSRAYGMAGQLAWSERTAQKSIEYKYKWVQTLKFQPNREIYGKALNNLGVTYKNAGLEIKALEALMEALSIAEEHADNAQIAITLNNIGNVYKNRKEYEDALKTHFRALTIRQQLNQPTDLADTHNNLGLVFRKMNQYDSAKYHFKQSIFYRQPTGDERRLSYAYNNLGLVLMDEGKPDSALIYYDQSLKLKERNGDARDFAIAHHNIGEALLVMNRYTEALSSFEKTGSYCLGKGYADVEIELYENMANLHARLNEHQKSFEYLKLRNNLKDSIQQVNLTKNLRDVEASFELEKSQNEIVRLEQERQLKELKLQNAELARNTLLMALFAIAIIVVVLLLRSRSINQLNKNLQVANADLQATRVSKEEKETLLKEVHHRVKNNLQIITSLLRLQSENIRDPLVSSLFNESQDRIKTMALVHEELYRSDDFTSIQVENYFHNLITELLATYSLSTKVSYILNTNVKKLGVNTLIPLGLMVNEMITNALKHAFNGGSGHINMELFQEANGEFSLKLSDDGRGFPEGIMLNEPSTLGLELIHTLAAQLDGSVIFSNNPGAEHTVTFRSQD